MENNNFVPPVNGPAPQDGFKPKGRKKFWYTIAAIVVIFAVVYLAIIVFGNSGNNNSQSNLGLVSVNASDRAQELANIKSAIKNKGAKWEAKDSDIFELSDSERKLRANLLPDQVSPATSVFQASSETVVPPSLDWRNNYGNFVTPIKNQGSCGSCWAFAITAGDESSNLIKNNTPSVNLDLSEQTVVSCSGYGSCNGGSTGAASSFARDTGIPAEACYPYTATNGSCSSACSNWQSSTYKIGSIISVSKNVSAIEQALNTYGPLIATFSVYSDFYSYGSGVYSYTSGTLLGGHAVLIVGYDDPGQYFIVKNSWGSGWGEGGFFRIAYSELTSVSNFGYTLQAFSSKAPQLTSINVILPNGGETWDAGGLTNRTITWNYAGDSTAAVKIELLKAGAVVKTLSPSVPVSNKLYTWNVPADLLPGSDYQVKITGNGNGITDTSDGNFTVSPVVPASLSLAYPVGGESFAPGSGMAIKWNFTGNPGLSLKIDLLKDGALLQNIVTGVNTSAGSYTWKLAKNQAVGTTYQIRITSNSNSAFTSTGAGFFSINSASRGKVGR